MSWGDRLSHLTLKVYILLKSHVSEKKNRRINTSRFDNKYYTRNIIIVPLATNRSINCK